MTDPDADSPCPIQHYPGPPLPTPNHIRLVFLQPGDDDSITCELQAAEIDATPAYEALSYTWGDPKDRQAIYIESRETGEKEEFLVTRNCFSALRRLRLTDRTRVLWIDALAIDQSSIAERNHQVTLMSQIYSKAAQVAIYLGESGDDSDFVLDMFELWVDVFSLSHSEMDPLCEDKSDRHIQALATFFQRPWFTRVWVIQEAVLSKNGTVYCGDRSISWTAIFNYNVYNFVFQWHRDLPFVVYASRIWPKDETIELCMFNALVQTRHCEATDPRDKVYSLLPLLHSFERQLDIVPSYGDPLAKVFTDTAVALIAGCGTVLGAVQGTSPIDGLPSWVPDWSIPPKRLLLGTPDWLLEKYWEEFWKGREHMDVPRKPPIVIDTTTSTLRLAGFRCGKIERLGSAYFAGKGHLPLEEWKSLRPDFEVSQDCFEDDPFYSVIKFGSDEKPSASDLHLFRAEEEELERSGSAMSWKRRVEQMTLERSKKRHPGGGQEDDDSYILPLEEIPFWQVGRRTIGEWLYLQGVLERCHGRRFFVTDRGHMGMAPAEAQVGDDVYNPIEAMPFILRDGQQSHVVQHSGVKRFRLVGECFLEKRALDDAVSEDFERIEIV